MWTPPLGSASATLLVCPQRGRKHESRSPSVCTPRRTQADGCDIDVDQTVQRPSSPTLANPDHKLDKVIQLQLSAQARVADLEKAMVSHDVSLWELGPINRSLADLSQKVEDIDTRLVQAEQKIAGPSWAPPPSRPSSLPPDLHSPPVH